MILNKLIEKEVKEYGSEYKERKEKGFRVISPSNAKKYYTNPYEWKQNTLDGITTFNGNTSTYLGNVIHKFAELHRQGKLNNDNTLPKIELDRIISNSTDIDLKEIYDKYPTMCKALLEEYLCIEREVLDSELYLEYELTEDKILIAGTLDELSNEDGKIYISDFKTSSSPYKDVYDLVGHIVQLSVYNALLLKTRGITVDKFRIVNIAQPTQKETNRVCILECDAILDLGQNLLNEIVNMIIYCDNNKDLIPLLFRDNPFDGFVVSNKDKLDILVNKYIKNFTIKSSNIKKIEKLKKDIFG